MTENKFIDVEKVLKDRAPGLTKWIPGFLVGWLKKKLHEDDINGIMHDLKDLHGLEYNKGVLEKLGANIIALNTHHVPKEGGIIIVSNHPLGGLDGISLVKAVGDIRSDVRFVVNDVLKSLKNYGDVFIGVNKINNTSAKSLRVMEDFLLTKDAVIFFPAGLVSRKQDGVIMDLEWKKGFVTQAIDHHRQIVPVYIEGENSKFFYRFANFRKRIGIKANIEMLFLPDEMFRQRGQTVKIHFGEPFDSSLLNGSRSHRKWAATIKEYVYSEEFKKGINFENFLKAGH
ncbi:MAG: 1-acyl-sn-glycerol-3-phosphate acyltransferase [Bacteroidota bacterium]|nr:1-acyl-sn-glycerol-3-phosphate acyltransferase [Bacteroidota bacterium]